MFVAVALQLLLHVVARGGVIGNVGNFCRAMTAQEVIFLWELWCRSNGVRTKNCLNRESLAEE